MALYHFHVTQIKRSAGQSACAAAAYRAGESIYSDYYGQTFDYTKKGGVIFSEITLPDYAPTKFYDRQTLWDELEFVEKNPKAQLAYSFDIALQNELSIEDNIQLARRFINENFVAKGMMVDWSVHSPDKGKNGISNPHFHALIPIRPLKPDGSWDEKQRRKYHLDENGNRIKNPSGKYVFDAIPTTDWNTPETLEMWRKNWAELVNQTFKEKGMAASIDHRTLKDQGLDNLPQIHEGPTVRSMEARGIKTYKGDMNRWIHSINTTLKKVIEQVELVAQWIAELTALIADKSAKEVKPIPTPRAIAIKYVCSLTDAPFKTNSARGKAIEKSMELYYKFDAFFTNNSINSFEDCDMYAARLKEKAYALNEKNRQADNTFKHFENLISAYNTYTTNKSVYENIPFLFKDAYKDKHKSELNQFYKARRILLDECPDGKFTPSIWKQELESSRNRCIEITRSVDELNNEIDIANQFKKAIDWWNANPNSYSDIPDDATTEAIEKIINTKIWKVRNNSVSAQLDAAKKKVEEERGNYYKITKYYPKENQKGNQIR